jgi:Cdc6-like AAA superfamily ATPase
MAGQIASHSDVRWGYVDAARWSTRAGLLHELLRDAGVGNHLPREGTPTDRFVEELRDLDSHVLAVVDEVNMIADDRTLLTLEGLPNVSLLCCTIDEDAFFSSIDNRVRSRFRSATVVSLDKYSHDELMDILRGRARAGLREDVVDDEVLEAIADHAAGDARHAIATLRHAAQFARREGHDKIRGDHIGEHSQRARADHYDDLVDSLGTHKRLLFDIVQEAGEVDCSDLHSRYEQRISAPKSRPTRRRLLSSLEDYELIEGVGNGPARRYLLRSVDGH